MINNNNGGTSISFLSLLGLLFIGLKLTGYIAWSWWWVLVPFWGGLAFLVVIGVIAVILSGIAAIFKT